MNKFVSILLFVPAIAGAANLTTFWASDGGEKQPRNVCFPHGVAFSSSTLNRTWDGKTITPFTAQNQVSGFEVIGCDTGGTDASSVTVVMSSMTCQGGTGIVSVVVSSLNVTDTSQRPIQTFSAWYVKNIGLSVFPWDHSQYEMRQYPVDLRAPCTVNVNNDCAPNSTPVWANLNYANYYIPNAWVPEEEFLISSETVKAGNSKSWYVDVYTTTTIPAGACLGHFDVYEGPVLSTSLPVNMLVYGYKMPDKPGLLGIVDIGNGDTNGRLNGNRSPSLPLTGAPLAAVNNITKLFKAHNYTVIGDAPDVATNDYPSAEYKKHLDGTLFTAANGYGNARGISTPAPFYMLGAYASWQANPNFSPTNAALFCAAVSSWSANLSSYANLKVGLYGQDEVADQTTNEKWATWLTTSCSIPGAHISMFVTGALPTLAGATPHTQLPASTGVFGNGVNSSSATWQSTADAYQVGPDSAVFRYNAGVFGQGAVFTLEEEGYVPEANYWGYWKKLCPTGVCHGGWFAWEGNYWRDTNNGGQPNSNDNDLFNVAKTFGYDAFPSTSSQFGHFGFNYTQMDGVLALPGTDLTFANPSFGFNGGIATFTLKRMRAGMDDIDLLNAAYAVNASSTIALVNQMYSKALWEVTCFTTGDCTYSFGDRTWAYTADAWTMARERLLIMAATVPPPPGTSQSSIWQGNFVLRGQNRIQ